jgi:hypothetical protein
LKTKAVPKISFETGPACPGISVFGQLSYQAPRGFEIKPGVFSKTRRVSGNPPHTRSFYYG